MSVKKYVPIGLLMDLLGGHQQQTTWNKNELQGDQDKMGLRGLNGAKYGMVIWLNFWIKTPWVQSFISGECVKV